MMDWSYRGEWMGFGWIFMIFFWALVILGVIALLRWLGMSGNGHRRAQRKTPLEILQERYARGEIEREEYKQKRHDLEE